MEQYIERGLQAASAAKISGKEVTPFILKYLAEYTKGESLQANIALIQNNVKPGAEIAKLFMALQ